MNQVRLVEEGDAILHRRIAEVTWPKDNAAYWPVVNDLQHDRDAMMTFIQKHGGVALAANQVGFDVRMFVLAKIPIFQEVPSTFFTCVNPEILERSGIGVRGTEYCMNFPDVGFEISRPARIVFTACTIEGTSFEHTATGDAAREVSQAIDLLDGITLFDIAG